MASCGYSCFVGDACGPSSFNPANVACIAISDCRKDVRSHLEYCKISDDSGVDSEAKLLLTRAAICRQCREYLINIMSRVTVSEDISEPIQSSVMPSDKEEQEKSDKSAQEEEDDISAASDEDLTAGLGRMTISDDSPVFSPESASTVSSSGEESGFARVVARPREAFNIFLNHCQIQPLGRPWLEWGEVSVRTRQRYVQRSSEIVSAVLKKGGQQLLFCLKIDLAGPPPGINNEWSLMAAVDVDRRIVGGWFTFCASKRAVCLVLIAFFYRKVYLGIRNRQINEISQVTEQEKAKLESKVAKMTGLLTAALMSTFIPIFGFEILGNFLPIFNSSAAIRFTDTVTQFNSLFNPLLYGYRDQRFRNALRELLGKRKPQALKSAVDVARDRSVRRNDLSASTETQIVETSTTHLTKPVFSNLLAALDSAHRRPREVMLKRSMSDQMIDKFSSSIDGLELQQTSPIVVTSATVHVESRVQCKAKKNNPVCANGVNKPQVTPQLFPNKPTSKSCDPITSVGFTNLVNEQFAIEDPN
ncbi:hypothetical protein ACROYT_G027746 [Oculina patagonica]